MESLRRFILESAFTPDFAKAVYDAIGLLEAVNINKALLVKEAGSPEAVKKIKDRVNHIWKDNRMDGVVQGNNLLQKLMNFLYLMEIRQDGFVDRDLLQQIHDVAIHGSLEQRFLSNVNSDTTPEQAMEILGAANESARQSAKPYPDLSPSEEKIWNRVRVYHEFPDGFKWVYAVDAHGKVSGYMPSSITDKTMHHCGNQPSNKSGNEYWELRDNTGKAYLTVILNEHGQIEESKSWGNQTNKYRVKILPYVKWFLKDQKVTGVGYRYDFGYAADKNFGVKDFIGDDPEFIDYVIENKEELIGATESRILFWKDAIDQGFVTVDDLKKAYMDGMRLSKFLDAIPGLDEFSKTAKFQIKSTRADPADSIFGANSFSVLCAVCNGNPFTLEEITKLIDDERLSLEVFANYNIRLLTPEIQAAFVRKNPHNLDKLIEISNQVASFKVASDLWLSLLPTEEEVAHVPSKADSGILDRCKRLINLVVNAHPPSKMADTAEAMMQNVPFLKYIYGVMSLSDRQYERRFERWSGDTPGNIYMNFATIIGNYPDMQLPNAFTKIHKKCIRSLLVEVGADTEGHLNLQRILSGDKQIGSPRNEPLLAHYSDDILGHCLQMLNTVDEYSRIKDILSMMCEMFTPGRIKGIVAELGERSPAVAGALCVLLPADEMSEEFARTTVNTFVYDKKSNGRYAWSNKTYGWERNADHPDVVMDIMLRYPGLFEGLDWTRDEPYMATARLLREMSDYDIKIDKDSITRIVLFYIGKMSENNKLAYKVCQDSGAYGSKGLLRSMQALITSYNIDDPIVSEFYRTQAELSLSNHPDQDVVGAWKMFTIPFEEWESEFARFEFTFITHYVLLVPTDTMIANQFITDFVCDKLLESNDENGIMEFVRMLSYDYNRAKKSNLTKIISRRIVEDRFPLSDSLFNRLYDARMINAEAYRAVMGRREDRGAMTVEDTPTAANVLKAFNSIQKLDTLPELIAATFKYLTDTIYENMGDGRFRWKVDENCGEEVGILSALSSKLASKSTTGKIPLAIKKLFDDGIVARLEKFESANRQACETPGKPKSKITCSSVSDINEAVWSLNRDKDAVFAAAAKASAAPKRKAPSRKKAATA